MGAPSFSGKEEQGDGNGTNEGRKGLPGPCGGRGNARPSQGANAVQVKCLCRPIADVHGFQRARRREAVAAQCLPAVHPTTRKRERSRMVNADGTRTSNQRCGRLMRAGGPGLPQETHSAVSDHLQQPCSTCRAKFHRPPAQSVLADRHHLPENCDRPWYSKNGRPAWGRKNGIALGGCLWLKFRLLFKVP